MKTFTLLSLLSLPFTSPVLGSSQDQRISYLEREVTELRQQVRDMNSKIGRSSVTRSQSTRQSSSDYRVKSGDTFWGIAKTHNISVSSLESANPRLNPSRLKVGASISIPGRQSTPPTSSSVARPSGPTKGYSIRNGETLGHIANRYGISLRELMLSNPGLNPRRLQIGQTIRVPDNQTTSAPRATFHETRRQSTPTPPRSERIVERRATVPAPACEPAHQTAAPTRASGPELVTVGQNRRLDEIARFYGTDVPTINSLNQVSLSPAQVIKMGSQLYVPQQ